VGVWEAGPTGEAAEDEVANTSGFEGDGRLEIVEFEEDSASTI